MKLMSVNDKLPSTQAEMKGVGGSTRGSLLIATVGYWLRSTGPSLALTVPDGVS